MSAASPGCAKSLLQRLLDVFAGGLARKPELRRNPGSQSLVAAGFRLEPQFLVAGEFRLVTVFAFVKCGHGLFLGRDALPKAAPRGL